MQGTGLWLNSIPSLSMEMYKYTESLLVENRLEVRILLLGLPIHTWSVHAVDSLQREYSGWEKKLRKAASVIFFWARSDGERIY